MWRSFFIAVGFCLLVIGGECLVVDDFILSSKAAAAAEGRGEARYQAA